MTPATSIWKSALLALLLLPPPLPSVSFAADLDASPTRAPLFRDFGIASGEPVHVLPQNAIVHLQLNQPQRILENLEQLLVNSAPRNLLPPPLQNLLDQPHPLLTALGLNSIGAPLTADQIAEKTGLATDQPASLTLYPGLPPKSFVLSLPVRNFDAFGNFAGAFLQRFKPESESLGDKSFVRLTLGHPRLGELFLTASSDRVFITGEQSLLFLLYPDNSLPRLKESQHFASVTRQAAPQDVWLTVDPAMVKPLLLPLELFKFFPLQILSKKRTELLEQLPDQQRQILEQQIRSQFKVRDLEQFADYAESVLSAAYHEFIDFLFTHLKAFNGVTLAAKVDARFPQVSAFLHSDQVREAAGAQPVPMDAVRAALARLPGQHIHISVTGRQPPAAPSARMTSFLKRLRAGFEAKNLNLRLIEALEKWHQETLRPHPIAAQVPWMIQTRVPVNPPTRPADHESLDRYLRELFTLLAFPASRQVAILPQTGADVLERTLRAQQLALARNQTLLKETFAGDDPLQSFVQTLYRLQDRNLEGGVKELTWETAFVTRGGLFGFNQHEFINRRVHYARSVGDYFVYHQASKDPNWIRALQLRAEDNLSSGLAKLLDRVPPSATSFTIHRPLAHLPGALQWLREIEDLAHRDVNGYLEKARAILGNTSPSPEQLRQLEALKFPLLAASLNRDPDSGDLYALAPGGFSLPRPKITPSLQKLFRDFNRSADDVGGMLCYTAVRDGAAEVAFVQSIEALSKLIQTVGNNLQADFLSDPEQMTALQQSLGAERDRRPPEASEILLRNPDWAFLPTPVRKEERQQEELPDAAILTPIPPRSEETPQNLLDLTPHYNASPKDAWHAGGVPDNDLGALPEGVSKFAGVPFDVRGIVQLSGQGALEQLSARFPDAVEGIQVSQVCDELHFLHGTGWVSPDKTKIGAFRVHYVDGETAEIPIVYGAHVRDWWTPPNTPPVTASELAWEGANRASKESGMRLRLYKTRWVNPRPEAPIATLDYVSELAPSAPFLLAITTISNSDPAPEN